MQCWVVRTMRRLDTTLSSALTAVSMPARALVVLLYADTSFLHLIYDVLLLLCRERPRMRAR